MKHIIIKTLPVMLDDNLIGEIKVKRFENEILNSYWAYSITGHLIGYSSNQSRIITRLKNYARKRIKDEKISNV